MRVVEMAAWWVCWKVDQKADRSALQLAGSWAVRMADK
jgi:hypothetical protein